MNPRYLFQVRVTGLLIQDDQVLIVKQKISNSRNWSLPGGRLEQGEHIGDAIIREMEEETGYKTVIKNLLYLCENPEADPPLLHITFLLEAIGGTLTLPSNEFDLNPIHDVKWVPIREISEYGFSTEFRDLLLKGQPLHGTYKGHKRNIGL